MKEEKINCVKCQHFYVTWDKKFPRGCRALNFKSAQLPSVVVQKSSGDRCLYYQDKE